MEELTSVRGTIGYPPYPESVVDSMNTGRGIRGREADGRPVPYNAA